MRNRGMENSPHQGHLVVTWQSSDFLDSKLGVLVTAVHSLLDIFKNGTVVWSSRHTFCRRSWDSHVSFSVCWVAIGRKKHYVIVILKKKQLASWAHETVCVVKELFFNSSFLYCQLLLFFSMFLGFCWCLLNGVISDGLYIENHLSIRPN